MFFRFLVIFFTIASLVLSVWSLVGSYKNESYLTGNYLFGFQTSNVNLSAIIREASQKRDFVPQELNAELLATPTTTGLLQPRDVLASLASAASIDTSAAAQLISGQTSAFQSILSSATGLSINTASLISEFATATDQVNQLLLIASAASIPDSIVTLAASLSGNVDEIVEDLIANANVTDLGLAEYYSIGYWGYCRGSVGSTEEWLEELGKFGTQFNNKNVNFTYCSLPKAGFKFDPLDLLKHELVNLIEGKIDGLSDALPDQLTDTIEAELLALVSSVTYEDLGLPGNLKDVLNLLHNLTVVSFALILAGACLAFISLVFQLIGLFCSPENSCLSCLSFLLMVIVFIVTLVGSALSTGTYIYTRQEVNNNVEQYGLKGWLSVQYYAFLWSSAVAALILVVVAMLGYCCGCFHSGKRRYRLVRNEHHEPVMGYNHTYKGNNPH